MYRIVVTDEESDTTVFELAGPAAMVARLAPSALAEALGSAVDEELGSAPADSTQGAPRRRRRSKAEMEAARAAETNGGITPESVSAGPSGDVPYNPFSS